MKKVTLTLEGMSCGMCEAHVKDVIRKALPRATRLQASHKSGIVTFVCDAAPEQALLQPAMEATGYRLLRLQVADVEAKKAFSLFRRPSGGSCQ